MVVMIPVSAATSRIRLLCASAEDRLSLVEGDGRFGAAHLVARRRPLLPSGVSRNACSSPRYVPEPTMAPVSSTPVADVSSHSDELRTMALRSLIPPLVQTIAR